MKTHLGLRQLRVLAVAAAGVASHCAAGTIVTVPPGLTPGSQYRLVYVTADPYTATSSSINDYNNDVKTEAGGLVGRSIIGPIVYAESGAPFPPPYQFVWTGSTAAGDTYAGYALGDPGPLLVFGPAGAGYDNSQWIQAATGGPKTVGLS